MNPRDLDNWITGHYGEDYFREDDMEKQDVKIIIDASTTREDAETLIEFLSKLLNETMGIEAIVSFLIEDKARIEQAVQEMKRMQKIEQIELREDENKNESQNY